MTNESIEEKYKALLWGVQLSVRYHQHRRRFFDSWHRLFNFFIIILGSTGMANLMSSEFTPILCYGLITLFSTTILVFSLNEKGRTHFYLAKKFIDIEKNIIQSESSLTEEKLITLSQERLSVESVEPPVMNIIYDICYNEMLFKKGDEQDNMVKFKWYQPWIKNIANWGT